MNVSSMLEIVELTNGDIVLQRADDHDDEALVTIRFSEASDSYMPYMRLEVAKAMIQAGIQAFSELSEQASVEELDDMDMAEERVVH